MKKELIAAVLLAVIFAGVMLNIRASEKIVSSLMSEVDAAYAQLKSGDSESAAETLDKAIEHPYDRALFLLYVMKIPLSSERV